MQTLQFNGTDPRDLIEVLIRALDVTLDEGKPAIEVHGVAYGNFMKLIDYFPDEALTASHQAMVDAVFLKKQRGYKSTSCNIITRMYRIDNKRRYGAALRDITPGMREETIARLEREHSAAGEAVALLTERLGDDLERFLSLATVAGPHRLHVAFKSIQA